MVFRESVMSESLVSKLLESFDELDRCISVTKEVLVNKPGVPADVVTRIAQYTEIVAKQRELAVELKEQVGRQNWIEVGRLVKIINGLSSMIRDDAQAILSGALTSESSLKEDQFLC